jgi:hypothetical protein
VQSVLAAAFLVNEQQRALTLEIRPKKGFLGLGTVQALFAVPAGPLPAWPPMTAEAGLAAGAARQAPYNQNEVYMVVYNWLGHDSSAPFEDVLEKVKAGLAERLLLGVHQEKKLKIFTVRSYVIPDSTRALAAASPWGTIAQIMQYTQQTRPLVWQKLNEDIKKAVAARQERTDTSDSRQ